MSRANVKLLRATLAQIEAHPHTWNQRHWSKDTDCGTAMCFAGWAVELDGAKWVAPESGLLIARDDDPIDDRHNVDADCWVYIEDRARRILGLNRDEADDLFGPDNTMPDLRRKVAALIGEPA